MELAAAKDSGFTPQRFVEAIEAISRLPREDFPVDDARLAVACLLNARIVDIVRNTNTRMRPAQRTGWTIDTVRIKPPAPPAATAGRQRID